MSDVHVITEHVEQLLDIFASNPSYNSRAVFLLADDLAELMLKSHVRTWRQRNAGVIAEPDNFPQACIFAVLTWTPRANKVPAAVKTAWEALEADPKKRWFGNHLTLIQAHPDYHAIKTRCRTGVDAVESALVLHQHRNSLYHDPSNMRLAPSEKAVCDAVANLLTLGCTLYTRRFERLVRTSPLGRALYSWFWLHRTRYTDDKVRRSLEESLQDQPTSGLDKLQRFNRQEQGWVFVRDPDFGHAWMLIHHDSTTFAQVLESAAVKHKLVKPFRN